MQASGARASTTAQPAVTGTPNTKSADAETPLGAGRTTGRPEQRREGARAREVEELLKTSSIRCPLAALSVASA